MIDAHNRLVDIPPALAAESEGSGLGGFEGVARPVRFSGKCRGNVDKAFAGINHIALLTAEPGVYDDCTMTLTDSSNNQSQPLKISPFVVVGGQS